MNLPISFAFAGLPGGLAYCVESWQRLAQDIAAGMSGSLTGGLFNYGNTEPDPADRGKPWLRLFGDGSPDRWFVYFGGNWVSPYRIPASAKERIWWVGTESEAWSYDGGDGTDPSSVAPTATTGAFWEKDDDYDARIPIQIGTLPSGTVLSPGSTGGTETHQLTAPELPELAGELTVNGYRVDSGSNTGIPRFEGPGVDPLPEVSANLEVNTDTQTVPGTANAINWMNPYRAGMWLKRTARVYATPI